MAKMSFRFSRFGLRLLFALVLASGGILGALRWEARRWELEWEAEQQFIAELESLDVLTGFERKEVCQPALSAVAWMIAPDRLNRVVQLHLGHVRFNDPVDPAWSARVQLAFQRLPVLTQLRQLAISPIPGVRYVTIGRFPLLEAVELLGFDEPHELADLMRSLSRLPRLSSLTSGSPAHSEASLTWIGRMAALESLMLVHHVGANNQINSIGPQSWRNLAGALRLKKLWVEGFVVRLDVLSTCPWFTQVEELRVCGSDLDNQDLTKLKKCRQLALLDLTNNPRITEVGICEMCESPALIHLVLIGTGVPISARSEIQRALPQLKVLELN